MSVTARQAGKAYTDIRHLFVINPHSFSAGIEQVRADIAQCGVRHDIHVSRYPRDAVAVVHRYIEGVPPETGVRVYAMGGDGILFDCLNGLVGFPNAELTSVPYGKSNDFVRAFGENALQRFLDIQSLLHAPSRPIDIIHCGSNYAINQVGLGLEGQASIDAGAFFRHSRSKWIKPFTGEIYTLASLRTLFIEEVMRQEYRVLLDGEEYSGRYFDIKVTNGACSGGDMVINPYAIPDDGLLEVIFGLPCSTAAVIHLLRDYTKGYFEKYDKIFFQRRFRKLELSSAMPIRVHMDGEAFYTDELKVEIVPGGVRFFAPEGLDFLDYRHRAYKANTKKGGDGR